MIDPLTEHGLTLHDQVFDLERLSARQQETIQRQAAPLKQKRDRSVVTTLKMQARPIFEFLVETKETRLCSRGWTE